MHFLPLPRALITSQHDYLFTCLSFFSLPLTLLWSPWEEPRFTVTSLQPGGVAQGRVLNVCWTNEWLFSCVSLLLLSWTMQLNPWFETGLFWLQEKNTQGRGVGESRAQARSQGRAGHADLGTVLPPGSPSRPQGQESVGFTLVLCCHLMPAEPLYFLPPCFWPFSQHLYSVASADAQFLLPHNPRCMRPTVGSLLSMLSSLDVSFER